MTIKLNKTIVLIGLMGAGKSSIGKRLAKKLGLDFVDLDREIETREKMTVSEIFEKEGEDYFREMERKIIASDIKYPPHILSPGGGAYMCAKTRKTLKEYAITIWLKAEVDILVERVSRKNTRPLLKDGDPREIMERLVKERHPIYAEADYTVESNNAAHDVVVEKIIAILENMNHAAS